MIHSFILVNLMRQQAKYAVDPQQNHMSQVSFFQWSARLQFAHRQQKRSFFWNKSALSIHTPGASLPEP
jgi:hypothetical protein